MILSKIVSIILKQKIQNILCSRNLLGWVSRDRKIFKKMTLNRKYFINIAKVVDVCSILIFEFEILDNC